MPKILCSTGALIGRPNNRDYRLLKKLSSEIKSDGFEFMMYSSWYDDVDNIIDVIKSNNIFTPVYHTQKSIGELISKGSPLEIKEAEKLFSINCEMAKKLDATKIVMHLWDGITSDKNILSNINEYAQLRKIADSLDIDLLIENVVCNQNDPMTHWVELYEKYKDIHFIFDTKMAAFHNQLDSLYEEKNSWLWKEGHIRHYHVNDYAGGYMDWANLRTLPIGKGSIDFEKFISFIKKINYNDTFTIESTAFNKEGIIDTQMLNEQIIFLKENL